PVSPAHVRIERFSLLGAGDLARVRPRDLSRRLRNPRLRFSLSAGGQNRRCRGEHKPEAQAKERGPATLRWRFRLVSASPKQGRRMVLPGLPGDFLACGDSSPRTRSRAEGDTSRGISKRWPRFAVRQVQAECPGRWYFTRAARPHAAMGEGF